MARLCGYANGGGGLIPAEAQFLRRAASRLSVVDPPEAQNAVAEWVNREGGRTVRGGLWRGETLMKTLANPRMAGLDSDGRPIEDFGETVLTPEEYRALLAARSEIRGEPTERRDAYDYLLTKGLSDCDACGYDLSGGRVHSEAAPGYRCLPPTEHRASCGKIRMDAARLEGAVAEEVLADILRPGQHDALLRLQQDARDEAQRLRAHIESSDDRFAALKAMRQQMLLSAYKAAEKATKDDLTAARTRLRFLEQMAGVPLSDVHDVVSWWNSAPRASQRALIMLSVTKVHVVASGGGRGHDPHGRIRIDWRTSAA
ncbi:hypothetical protein ACFXJO_04350 [Streptomyces lavendulae]|uniref:hypothetical protein n=1 Tax=Streptomyces lavendulae TaxID=1914 RepID=UPI00369EC636